MRIGINPNRDKIIEANDFFHQVIIPVYIPNEEDYFKDSFQILKYCLESLFKTSHVNTYFTVVNNGSCQGVVDYLNTLHQSGRVQEIMHTSAIGKMNAILKGLIGQNFKLVTITDADVLFLNNWQNESYKIFEAFPKAGFVNPCPLSKVLKRYTYNIIWDNFFSRKLKFTKVKNPDALMNFAKSIGNLDLYNKYHLEQYLTISNSNQTAVVGGGHFVGTYRSEVFKNITQKYSEFSLGGTSENNILDKPVVENGFWRLSTHDNYAYHMGNTVEKWMDEIPLVNLKSEISPPMLKTIRVSKSSDWIKRQFFYLFLSRKGIWIKFLVFKGLNKKAKNY